MVDLKLTWEWLVNLSVETSHDVLRQAKVQAVSQEVYFISTIMEVLLKMASCQNVNVPR
jgi:hypothetical protein